MFFFSNQILQDECETESFGASCVPSAHSGERLCVLTHQRGGVQIDVSSLQVTATAHKG